MPVDDPEKAAVDGDLGNNPPRIGKARLWPFRAGGRAPRVKDPIAGKIQDEDQCAGRDREAAEQTPKGAQNS